MSEVVFDILTIEAIEKMRAETDHAIKILTAIGGSNGIPQEAKEMWALLQTCVYHMRRSEALSGIPDPARFVAAARKLAMIAALSANYTRAEFEDAIKSAATELDSADAPS